jgi:hypothetical protein
LITSRILYFVVDSLPDLCGNKVKLELGKIRTYLPSTSTPEAIHQFEFGGKLPQPPQTSFVRGGHIVPIPNLDEVLIARIQAHLSSDDSAFCVFENGTVRPDYPAMHRLPKIRTFICADTVPLSGEPHRQEGERQKAKTGAAR